MHVGLVNRITKIRDSLSGTKSSIFTFAWRMRIGMWIAEIFWSETNPTSFWNQLHYKVGCTKKLDHFKVTEQIFSKGNRVSFLLIRNDTWLSLPVKKNSNIGIFRHRKLIGWILTFREKKLNQIVRSRLMWSFRTITKVITLTEW